MRAMLSAIRKSKRGSPYSETDACADILDMADKNGVFRVSTRDLRSRWGWGSNKLTSFMKELEKQCAIIVISKDKNGTEYRINDYEKSLSGAQTERKTERKRSAETIENTVIASIERSANGAQNGAQTERKNTDMISADDAYQMIADTWNALADCGIGPVFLDGLTKVQKKSIVALAKEYTVSDILATIAKIRMSGFLQGKNEKGWKITFNWFLRKENYEKVRGGEYEGSRRSKTQLEMDEHKERMKRFVESEGIQDDKTGVCDFIECNQGVLPKREGS